MAFASLTTLFVAAAALRHFDWAHLHVVLDERYLRLLPVQVDVQPFARSFGAAVEQMWWKFGLLPLLVVAWKAGGKRYALREHWLLVVTGVFYAMMLWQMRWRDFFVAGLVMAAGVVVVGLVRNRRWLGVALVAAATTPQWWMAARIHRNIELVRGNPMVGPYVAIFALEAVSDCLARANDYPIVLAATDFGPTLAGMGKVRVVGTAFWTNLQAMRDTHEMFTTTSPERFWQLVNQRGIGYLLVPNAVQEAASIKLAYAALGKPCPDGGCIYRTVVWQIARSHEYPVVECAELSRVAPQWRILRLHRINRESRTGP
jgi:hypothetical protein